MPTVPAPWSPEPTESVEPSDEAILAALTVILMAGLTVDQTTAFAQSTLSALAIPPWATANAVALMHPHLPPPVLDVAPLTATGHDNRTGWPRRAAYVKNAARRIAGGGITNLGESIRAERRYLRMHLDADRRRRDAARKVDEAAKRHGPVLGWHAKQPFDLATTLECRNAHGKNFRADRPPKLGFPGTLHGGTCRCAASAPWPGSRLLD